MSHEQHFYIDGQWVDPLGRERLDVVNPATEQAIATIALGTAADVDRAVTAARKAFPAWSESSRADRLALFGRIGEEYQRRYADLAAAVTAEMGAPTALATQAQAALGLGHLQAAAAVLERFDFETAQGSTRIVREPIGVCALITPWNWPLNQITTKVFPALATGCTMVLKPSEVAPLSALIFAEILDAAGVPAGVFNLVNGTGAEVGTALSTHPEVDMVSFTGSTRAGIEVARAAAPSVKRVHQELGGKSANILLADADLPAAVMASMRALLMNSGQSCNAPTRLLVPRQRLAEAEQVAAAVANGARVGDPTGDFDLGPVSSAMQWGKVQQLIERGVAEGARLVAGGPGKPDGLETGYYVRPTVFSDVANTMAIAREEIFGPVLVIIPYDSEEEAVTIANDTPFGLAAYVQSSDPNHARTVARRLRAGQVTINQAELDFMAPFGGYKQSGNGREWGEHAFGEYLETKAVIGWNA